MKGGRKLCINILIDKYIKMQNIDIQLQIKTKLLPYKERIRKKIVGP